MKKIKLAMAAMGAFALWTSCSNEEFPAPAPGGDGSVTFTATLPANINSRAYGDGEVAKTLHYAVYESGSDAVVFASDAADSPSAIVVSNTQFTLTLQLVKGKSYDFIFWADATEGSPYTFSSATKDVTVSYEDLSGNNENRDAFFQTVKDLEISGPMQQPVELRRPFAQFNILTSDLAALEAAGTSVAKVDVAVKGVRNSLNLYSGIADGAEDVTFTSEELPGQKYSIDGKEYDFLAMNYLLTGIELEGSDVQAAKRELMDASAVITFDAADGAATTVEVPSMPVQRNYRTNIYGALLTSPLDLTIDVMPEFFDENLMQLGPWDGVTLKEVTPVLVDGINTYTATSASEYAWICQNVKSTENIILAADIDLGNHPAPKVCKGMTYSGTFDGRNHTISNLFMSNTSSLGGAGLIVLAKNATVKNVTVSGGTLSAGDYAGAIVGKTNGGTTIENCHVKDMNISAKKAAAGIVGRLYSNDDKVIACTNSATISGDQKVGGIVAITNGTNVSIENCTNDGAVSGGSDGVGGILGYGNAVNVTGCTNNGKIGTGVENRAAGIVGYIQKDLTVENCTNNGDINAVQAGGISGQVGSYQVVTLTDVTNNGTITGKTIAGGIAASDGTGEITRCVNNGAVSASMENGFAGGVVGQKVGGALNDCNGGSAAVSAFGAARLVSAVLTGPDRTLTLNLDDNLYDENDIQTVFVMGPYTAWGVVTVAKGTLHGDPCADLGLGNTVLTINDGASWDLMEDPVGTWSKNKTTGLWVKK